MEPGEWNVNTLKEHFDALFAETEKRYQQRFDAQSKAIENALEAQKGAVKSAMDASEKAIIKAENAAEKRFEAVNEFRQTVTDITAGNSTKDEVRAIAERLTMADERNTADIQELKGWRNTTQGRGVGFNDVWAKLLGGVGLISTVIAIIVAIATRL